MPEKGDNMKIKSENTAKRELVVISLLLILKTVFTQPLYSNLLGIGSGGLGAMEITSAVGALVLSVIFSFVLIKTAKGIGEGATPLLLLAIAEPLFITTVSSLLHALAAIITVIWVAVCLTSKNKIVSAAVSAASAVESAVVCVASDGFADAVSVVVSSVPQAVRPAVSMDASRMAEIIRFSMGFPPLVYSAVFVSYSSL